MTPLPPLPPSPVPARVAGWLLAALLVAPAARAEEWPHWRGPRHDGTSADTALVAGWPAGGIADCWRRPLGAGYSSISVRGGVAHTLELVDGEEALVALDAASGEARWRAVLGPTRRGLYGGSGPRSTPTVTAERVFAATTDALLVALDPRDGERLWSLDLAAELGSRGPAEGYASSPLIRGDRLHVMVGGAAGRAFAALDPATGRVIWTSGDAPRASYSSPIPWRGGGVDQVLFLAARELVSVAPDDGELLWRHPWPTFDDVNVATPLPLPRDRLFVSAGYDMGAAVLEVSRSADGLAVEEVWRSRVMKNHFNSSVALDGVVYGFDEGTLKAVRGASGEEGWAERGLGKGSLIAAAGHLVVLGEDGELVLVEAHPTEYRERARHAVLDGRSWTPPALAGGRLYVRNREEIACLEPAAR